MARYVVIEFADNKEADSFVDSFQAGTVFFAKPHPTLPDMYSQVSPHNPANVVGYYMRPTLPCDCPPVDRNKQVGYTRGRKYGIWVHAACAKVNKVSLSFWGQRPGLGRNLLIDDKPEFEGLLRIDGSLPEYAEDKPRP